METLTELETLVTSIKVDAEKFLTKKIKVLVLELENQLKN